MCCVETELLFLHCLNCCRDSRTFQLPEQTHKFLVFYYGILCVFHNILTQNWIKFSEITSRSRTCWYDSNSSSSSTSQFCPSSPLRIDERPSSKWLRCDSWKWNNFTKNWENGEMRKKGRKTKIYTMPEGVDDMPDARCGAEGWERCERLVRSSKLWAFSVSAAELREQWKNTTADLIICLDLFFRWIH